MSFSFLYNFIMLFSYAVILKVISTFQNRVELRIYGNYIDETIILNLLHSLLIQMYMHFKCINRFFFYYLYYTWSFCEKMKKNKLLSLSTYIIYVLWRQSSNSDVVFTVIKQFFIFCVFDINFYLELFKSFNWFYLQQLRKWLLYLFFIV